MCGVCIVYEVCVVGSCVSVCVWCVFGDVYVYSVCVCDVCGACVWG